MASYYLHDSFTNPNCIYITTYFWAACTLRQVGTNDAKRKLLVLLLFVNVVLGITNTTCAMNSRNLHDGSKAKTCRVHRIVGAGGKRVTLRMMGLYYVWYLKIVLHLQLNSRIFRSHSHLVLGVRLS